MGISNWLNNNKVEVSFVEHRGCKFLVYTSMVGSHRVVLIEEKQSGAKVFPTEHPRIESGADMDKFVTSLLDKIIEENFARARD